MLLSLAAYPVIPAAVAAESAPSFVDLNFAHAATQYTRMLASIKDDPGIPRTLEGGKVVTIDPRDWTSGFFPGSLWLLFEHTKDEKWKAAAVDYTARLESIKTYDGTHDLGFMLGCSYGQGLRLTGDPAYRSVLLTGARTLAGRYNDKVGAIRSWDFGPWKFPVIVDNMMNLELLTWASREGGGQDLLEIAMRHADTTARDHFRPDNSSVHLVDYHPTTGKVLKKQTVQGAADASSWARGQAWGLYGYTAMYRETREPAYLTRALAIADFLLNHPRLPADGIPYWDFDAPGLPKVPRDSSAAAIMSSALFELAGFADISRAANYRTMAVRQLRSLASPAYRAGIGANGNFILMHATGHHPEGREVDVPLVYGDYYFLEALGRFAASLK
jgi:unsaturated chondroitin disaccharide hydrolase